MTASEIIKDSVRLQFGSPWDAEGHALFIKSKKLPEARYQFDRITDTYTVTAPARFAHLVGLVAPELKASPLPIADYLFPVQKWIVERALLAKRYAVWADCGFGKTPMALEWARHVQHVTGGRVLIMCPKNVLSQWQDEARKFYPDDSVQLHVLKTRDEIQAWCKGEVGTGHKIAITNWEKFADRNLSDDFKHVIRHCSGVVLDESSILKGGGGVIKWNLIKSCRGIEYKLSLTATPAPNDTMEYASQASWLEKLRNEGEILWTYFVRDPKTQEWKVRPHARKAFYQFMSSWSIYIRKASAYGFEDAFNVAEPELTERKLAMTDAQAAELATFSKSTGNLFNEKLGIGERSKFSQIAKGFIYGDEDGKRTIKRIESQKPELVAAMIRVSIAEGKRGLCWTVFDEESNRIMEYLQGVEGVATLHGDTSDDEREVILERFRRGEIPWLISKGKLLGLGMNFPFLDEMIFSGFDDSWEMFYQSVRRGHRYGRKDQLKVRIPIIPDLEDHMWSNLIRKRGQWEADIAQQELNYAEALKAA